MVKKEEEKVSPMVEKIEKQNKELKKALNHADM